MKRLLHTVTTIVSWVSAFFSKTDALHKARFALPHELTSLLSHTLDETGLLVGMSHLGGLYRIRPTRERRELGNLLVTVRELITNKSNS